MRQLTTAAGSRQRSRAKVALPGGVARWAAWRVRAAGGPVQREVLTTRRRSLRVWCIDYQAGDPRGWRGGAAIGFAPRQRVSGRREPCRKAPAEGIEKL